MVYPQQLTNQFASVPSQVSAAQQVSQQPENTSQSRRLRIVLYSHDTMGLGHKRRNLLIAQTIGASALDADILLISGMRDASDTPTPDGVDTLTLPALYKRSDGKYQARRMSLKLKEIIRLRSKIILEAVKSFQPDVMIVDNVPRGAVRELDSTLEYLHVAKALRGNNAKPYTRCILGLRDVLDTPKVIKRAWKKARNFEAIRRYYDAVWVYGDAELYDIRTEIGFPDDIVQKMQPLGYLDQRARLNFITPRQNSLAQLTIPEEKDLVLCLVGGGQDGANLARAFVNSDFPKGTTGLLLAGPFMPKGVRSQLHAKAQRNHQCQVIDYVEEPTTLLARANRVIAMGGYNTTCEILSFQKPALMVPRVAPRREQWIRAKRLEERGILDVLHPDDVCAEALTQWLHQSGSHGPFPNKSAAGDRKASLNLRGLDNLLNALQDILKASVLGHHSSMSGTIFSPMAEAS